MPESDLYVLDADVFIAAHRGYYAFDIAPGFWSSLVQEASLGHILSIHQVLEELNRGYNPKQPDEYDNLAIWANDKFRPYFFKTDDQLVTDAYTDIINWVYANNSYTESAKEEFARVSDSWLIAFAKANNAVLVTNENKTKKISKIPIPAICKQFNVEYINTFEMLRRLGIHLD